MVKLYLSSRNGIAVTASLDPRILPASIAARLLLTTLVSGGHRTTLLISIFRSFRKLRDVPPLGEDCKRESASLQQEDPNTKERTDI